MANTEVILLDFWPSMYGMRVRVALADKGVKFEYKEENMAEKSSVLLEMNPVYKKIPVLIHNGKPICESLNVVRYIDEVWKDNVMLLPTDPYEKYQALFWADYVEKASTSIVFPFISDRVKQPLTEMQGKVAYNTPLWWDLPPNPAHSGSSSAPDCTFYFKQVFDSGRKLWMGKGEEKHTRKENYIESLRMLEGILGDKLYFGGENFGYLDISLIGICSWYYTYEKFGEFNTEIETPKIIAWMKRCMKRESVSKYVVEPLKVYDFALQIRKHYGIE
ncbi:hypothetical protein T459_24759 [Capsicum annuum]|uniref:glutathione transferase n=1 Tax=Capsicum annuum TaxID=4072 RepID=A0A2G2YIW4_CAPAN|nr:hypothetical protein T459_24759 [Capsicum annuum]